MPRLRNFFHGLPVVTTTVTRDAGVPIENSQAAVQRDAGVPIESSQASVARDASVPIENSATLFRDASAPIENTGLSPFALGMGWLVIQRLANVLSMSWTVQQINQYQKLAVALPMSWTVLNPPFGAVLPMTWRVIPNLPALFTGTGPYAPAGTFSPDVQRPTATVTKQP